MRIAHKAIAMILHNSILRGISHPDGDTSFHGTLEIGWFYNQTNLRYILTPLPLISCLTPGELVNCSKP